MFRIIELEGGQGKDRGRSGLVIPSDGQKTVLRNKNVIQNTFHDLTVAVTV
jgi:hypothetical protein